MTDAPMAHRNRGQAAFTLVEVLLTIGIMAVVMIPLLLWAGLVFQSGGDTGVADRTNEMTLLSERLNRDVSGSLVSSGADANFAATTATYATCGLSVADAANVFVTLGRADDGSGVAYYVKGTGPNRAVHRFECSDFTAKTNDDTEIVKRLDAVPVVKVDGSEVIATFDLTGLAPIQIRAERNLTEQVEVITPELVPVIDCTPSCSVNRKGSGQGAAGSGALSGALTLTGKYSASVSAAKPLTHYRWTFGDEGPTAVATAPIAMPSDGIVPAAAHTYVCRSVADVQPASDYWKAPDFACRFTATLQVWSSADGGINATTPTALTKQQIQVRNNPAKVVVSPSTMNVASYTTATFDASATFDIDGTVAGTTYQWDFGDPESAENTATTPIASHRYDVPEGTATTATLTVTDSDGETTVVKVPVVLSAAEPQTLLKASCAGGVTGQACLRNESAPWEVTFDAQVDNVDPTARITEIQWSINGQPVDSNGDPIADVWTSVCQPTCPRNAAGPAVPVLRMRHSYGYGQTQIRFAVRLNKVDASGIPIMVDAYETVAVQAPPTAVAAFVPGPTITPTGVGGAQRFILDATGSRDNNPGRAITAYEWVVKNSAGVTVYPTATFPANTKAPIIGCTGTETMADLTTGPCPSFPSLPAGKYVATLTVTNMFGKTDTVETDLKVNLPPTFTAKVPNCQGSNPCAYRRPGYTFPFETVADPDPATPAGPYTYTWTFVDSAGVSTTTTQVGNPQLATPKVFPTMGEQISASLRLTDSDGGVAERSFTFTVVNNPPIAAITAVSPPAASSSPFPANELNVFSARTASDPGTVRLSARTSRDSDTDDPLTSCTWTLDGNPVGTTLGCNDDLVLDWIGAGPGTHAVTLSVKDSNDAVKTSAAATIRLRDRPNVVTFSTAPGKPSSILDANSGTIYFSLSGTDVDGKPASGLKYLFNFGDSCDATGASCALTSLEPIKPGDEPGDANVGLYKHFFDKQPCLNQTPGKFTNSGSCGAWRVSVWSESAWPHATYSGEAPSAIAVPPNGWSTSRTVLIRTNITPRVRLTNAVSSPIGPDGATSVTPSTNGAIAAVLCRTGTTCSYQADASTSIDPDGSADHLSQCTGAEPGCLTYTWVGKTSSSTSYIPPTALTFSRTDVANPTVSYPTRWQNGSQWFTTDPALADATTTLVASSPEFLIQVTIKDRDGATFARELRVQIVLPPKVGSVCSTGLLTSLPRNVENKLDGSTWGLAGTTGCANVTQPAHLTGSGQYAGSYYKNLKDTSLRPIDMTVDLAPKDGANPATITRSASNTTDFVAAGFRVGSQVRLSKTGQTWNSYLGTLSDVTPSKLTFAGAGPSFTLSTGVADVGISTVCGGTDGGLSCIPSSGFGWNFTDASHPGADCNRTPTDRNLLVTFATACDGNVSLTVTDETGAVSNSASTAFRVVNAKPTARVSTISPQALTDPTEIVSAQSLQVQFDGRDSIDPDGGVPGPDGGATSCTGRTVAVPNCLTYLWTVQRTLPTPVTTLTTATTPDLTYTFATQGSYTVSLVVRDAALGSSTTTTVNVKVWDAPTVSIASTPAAACSGTPVKCILLDPQRTIDLTANATATGTTITGYDWDFKDPNGPGGATANRSTIAHPAPHTFEGPGSYLVTVTVTDGHGLTATAQVEVIVDAVSKPTVTAFVGSGAGAPACPVGRTDNCSVNTGVSPATIKFVAAATSTTSPIDHWVWKVGGVVQAGQTTSEFVGTFTQAGSVTATAFTQSGSSDTSAPFTFKLNALPTAVISQGTAPLTDPVILPRNALLSDPSDDQLTGATSTDSDPAEAGLPNNGIKNWTWTFLDDVGGGSCNAGPIDGKAPAVTLSPAVGCEGLMTLTVTDYDLGQRSVTARFKVEAAKPRVVLTTDPTNGIGSLPDGQAGPLPTITLIGDASTQPGNPGATLSYSWVIIKAPENAATAEGCFTGPSTPPCVFTDSTGANGRIQPALIAGDYVVYLRVTAGGLTSERSLAFSVNAPPTARLKATIASNSKGACTETGGLYSCKVFDPTLVPTDRGPYDVDLEDLSFDSDGSGVVGDWTRTWAIRNIDTGVTAISPERNETTYTQSFPGYGTYQVTMTVYDTVRAFSTTTALVTVYPRPTATIGATYTLPGPGPVTACTVGTDSACLINDSSGDATAAFTGGGTSPGGTIVGYEWTFDDPDSGADNTSSLRNPVHDYSDYGKFTVRLVVTDNYGAQAETTYVVKLNAPPSPVVWKGAGPATALTLQRGLVLTGLDGTRSTDADGGVVTWSWAFAESAASAVPAPHQCGATFSGSNPQNVLLSPPQVARPDLVACSGGMILTVTDTDGRAASSASVPFEVLNIRPVARLSATEGVKGSAPFSPTFVPFDDAGRSSNDPDTVTATPPRGAVTKYVWSVYSCAPPTWTSCTTLVRGPREMTTYSEFTALEEPGNALTAEGTYRVELVVIDSQGTSSDATLESSSMTVEVVRPPKPITTINNLRSPWSAQPGTVVLDGSSSQPGGSGAPITSYAWEVCRISISDNSKCDASPRSLHVYPVAAPGQTTANVVFPQVDADYLVQLTVQDADFVTATSSPWEILRVRVP